jgi:hypothetical protein
MYDEKKTPLDFFGIAYVQSQIDQMGMLLG